MSTENLSSSEARKKLADLAQDIGVAMMVTNIGHKPLSAIPMSTKKVDENGNIWFLSRLDSEHNNHIVKDNDVHLLYSKPSGMEFLSVYGKASVSTDKKILEELYSKIDDAWFDGIDDPNLTALVVSPKSAYYWDTKQNKYISLLKIGMSALNGNQKDIGEKGKLNL
ncbi:pyridoxamine 5'-phosphate oxidase family protein [Salegentibacter chungangensis]|uniref:Pyridoxamine 5'-phosphate oxidase family protein n=1 Tax=Salegentibacter chungangensis TaxID=1335724 RepID=A0ABW3NRN3_9FLAO